MIVLLLACSGDKGDTGTAALDTGLCTDAPVVTWDNFGDGFITQNCQACHASTTDNRNGAPESVTFDTHEEALAQANAILAVAAGESPTMPPQGGVSDDDRLLLEVWLTCWE